LDGKIFGFMSIQWVGFQFGVKLCLVFSLGAPNLVWIVKLVL